MPRTAELRTKLRGSSAHAGPTRLSPRDFGRQGSGVQRGERKRPLAEWVRQRPAAPLAHRRPRAPLSGYVPGEPDSVALGATRICSHDDSDQPPGNAGDMPEKIPRLPVVSANGNERSSRSRRFTHQRVTTAQTFQSQTWDDHLSWACCGTPRKRMKKKPGRQATTGLDTRWIIEGCVQPGASRSARRNRLHRPAQTHHPGSHKPTSPASTTAPRLEI